MKPDYQLPKRPPLITILVVLSVISALLAFSLWRAAPLDNFMKINVTLALVNLVGMVGYWQMRRWGVVFCLIATLSSIMYTMTLGVGWQAYTGAFGYALATVIGMFHLHDME